MSNTIQKISNTLHLLFTSYGFLFMRTWYSCSFDLCATGNRYVNNLNWKLPLLYDFNLIFCSLLTASLCVYIPKFCLHDLFVVILHWHIVEGGLLLTVKYGEPETAREWESDSQQPLSTKSCTPDANSFIFTSPSFSHIYTLRSVVTWRRFQAYPACSRWVMDVGVRRAAVLYSGHVFESIYPSTSVTPFQHSRFTHLSSNVTSIR